MGLFGDVVDVIAAPFDLASDVVTVASQNLLETVKSIGGPLTKWTGVNFALNVTVSGISLQFNIPEAVIRQLERIDDIKNLRDIFDIINPLHLGAVTALTATLMSAEEVLLSHAEPIPAAVKSDLLALGLPPLNQDILDSARFVTGDGRITLPHIINSAHGIFNNDRNHAVTVGRVILFRSGSPSRSYWAHELHHVFQYRKWGFPGFAARYINDYASVEAEAELTEWAALTGVTAGTLQSWRGERPAFGWQVAPTPFLGTRPYLPPLRALRRQRTS